MALKEENTGESAGVPPRRTLRSDNGPGVYGVDERTLREV
jgi:hypothetical protein